MMHTLCNLVMHALRNLVMHALCNLVMHALRNLTIRGNASGEDILRLILTCEDVREYTVYYFPSNESNLV